MTAAVIPLRRAPFITVDRGQGAITLRSEAETVALFGELAGSALWELACERALVNIPEPPLRPVPRHVKPAPAPAQVLNPFSFPKRCNRCGRTYCAAQWKRLAKGRTKHELVSSGEIALAETRFCVCEHELAIEVMP